MKEGDYIFLNEIDNIGKFHLYFAKPKILNSLNPILRVKVVDVKHYLLEPAYLSIDNAVHPCPLPIKYVSLSQIKSFRINSEEHFEASLILFSKDFKSRREFKISKKSYYVGSNVVAPTCINNIINVLNEYVEKDNNIMEINSEIFETNFRINNLLDFDLLDQINKLQINYYSNGSNTLGKDDSFWNEFEIHCLPNNIYLTETYVKILKNANLIDSVKLSDNKTFIFGTYGKDYGYISVSSKRSEIESDEEMTTFIRDFLKIRIKETICLIDERNQRIKKTN